MHVVGDGVYVLGAEHYANAAREGRKYAPDNLWRAESSRKPIKRNKAKSTAARKAQRHARRMNRK